MTDAKLDPITLEMFWRRLNSTVDELAATLKRTSFSTVVRDVNDYATAIFDRDARLLAQSPILRQASAARWAICCVACCGITRPKRLSMAMS